MLFHKQSGRLILLMLCLGLLLSTTTLAANDSNVLPGDVNRDGSVTASDALTVLQWSVGLHPDPLRRPVEYFHADMNGDGTIDASDALAILQVSVDLVRECAYRPSAFTTQTIPLACEYTLTPDYTVYFSSFKKAVDNLRQNGAVDNVQAQTLLEQYDAEFFQKNALVFGTDAISSAADVTVEKVLCARQRILVTLHDSETITEEAAGHLIILCIDQQELRQSGLFPKLDTARVWFERGDTIPHPNRTSRDFPLISPAAHEPLKHTGLTVLDSRDSIRNYLKRVRTLAAKESSDESTVQNTVAYCAEQLLLRDSDAYFSQYRTLIFEYAGYNTIPSYAFAGLEENTDGTTTLLVQKTQAVDNPISDAPQNLTIGALPVIRLLMIDLPVSDIGQSVQWVKTTDGEILVYPKLELSDSRLVLNPGAAAVVFLKTDSLDSVSFDYDPEQLTVVQGQRLSDGRIPVMISLHDIPEHTNTVLRIFYTHFPSIRKAVNVEATDVYQPAYYNCKQDYGCDWVPDLCAAWYTPAVDFKIEERPGEPLKYTFYYPPEQIPQTPRHFYLNMLLSTFNYNYQDGTFHRIWKRSPSPQGLIVDISIDDNTSYLGISFYSEYASSN